ncbi:hypothetical protein SESBI_01484 [Sesbania bispinosa]|nr:hypothetical protein SESBI_01484 [Sesbania bispinosa]
MLTIWSCSSHKVKVDPYISVKPCPGFIRSSSEDDEWRWKHALHCHLLSDGDKEINLGTIVVDPSMNFRRFITLLSQRVEISPYHLFVFLTTVGSDQKIPITAKVNLASIAGYGSAYYFFVKPSRQFRKSLTSNINPPQNVVLLRREAPASASASGGVDATLVVTMMAPPQQHPPIADGIDYRRNVMNFLRSQTLNDHHGGGSGAVCEVCLVGKLIGND